MPITIEMPKLSDTMTEGTLLRWVKKVGDSIAVGDVLAEVETDKATMEMEAFDEGTLSEPRKLVRNWLFYLQLANPSPQNPNRALLFRNNRTLKRRLMGKRNLPKLSSRNLLPLLKRHSRQIRKLECGLRHPRWLAKLRWNLAFS
jgi:hypothetical protein